MSLDLSTIGIFGLGNVGLVAATAYAELGFNVIGIEVIEEKVKKLNNNVLYFLENNLEETFIKNRDKLKFYVDFNEAKVCSTLIVCVGTPPRINGAVDLSQIKNTLIEICKVIKESSSFRVLVIRSTIPPETTRKQLIPLIELET